MSEVRSVQNVKRLYEATGELNPLGLKVSKELHDKLAAIYARHRNVDVHDLTNLIAGESRYVAAFASLNMRERFAKRKAK